MRVTKNKYNFQISFKFNNDSNSKMDGEQEKETIDKFISKCECFDFLAPVNESVQNYKKQIIAFSIQYGTRNEKTTSIFLKFLEDLRDTATKLLREKQYETACSYYCMCLGFIDPEDEIYLQKFILTKIDVLNKMMYCLLELAKQRRESKYYDWAIAFLEIFLQSIKECAFYCNILKSDVALLELNYFYLGRMHRKKKNMHKAIKTFLKTQEILTEKINSNIYERNQSLNIFSSNLHIKVLYKISKCYCEEDQNEQLIYEEVALRKSEQLNPSLFQYLNRKVRMHKSGKQFALLLSKLEGKKKVEEEVLKEIEGTTQRDGSSLYDVYLDRPNVDFGQYFMMTTPK